MHFLETLFSFLSFSRLIGASGMPRGPSTHKRTHVHAQAHLSRKRVRGPCLFIRPRVIIRWLRVWVRTRAEIFRSALPARLINDIFERRDAHRAHVPIIRLHWSVCVCVCVLCCVYIRMWRDVLHAKNREPGGSERDEL